MTTRPVKRLAAIAAAAVSVLGVATTVAPAALAAPGGTVTLSNTLPRWLASAKPVTTPSLTVAAPMTVRVLLAPRGGVAAVQAAVNRVSDPTSAQYRHFLTPAQYDATYAPTAAAADQVTRYLKAQGVHVDSVEAHRRYVTASADRATLAKAFGTTLSTLSHNGETVTANTTAVTLPAAVGAQVLTVSGLDTTVVKKTPNIIKDGAAAASAAGASTGNGPDLVVAPPAGFRNARPCNIDYGTLTATSLPSLGGEKLPYAPCGYTGPSYRAAYEANSDLTGAGVTVAITDAYAWQLIAQDSNTYASNNGDGSYAPGQLTQNLPATFSHEFACGPTGWSGEETLDVEAVHAMAPGAKIRYYGSRSCFDSDFQDTLARVVDENNAQLVTNSWSDLEENETTASVVSYEQVFLQGALQGISFLFSSGDNGDELAKSSVRQVDYPASDPLVTAAGGTSTAISRGRLTGQTGWGTHSLTLAPNGKSWVDTGFLYGAGGGFSALFDRPAYQDSKVPAASPAGRAVPDVAMDADPNTGMLIGQTQTFLVGGTHYDQYRIGGTSLASPLLAGMFALAAQHAGGGLGLLNPLLYKAGGAITDVKASGMPDPGVVRVNYNNGERLQPITFPRVGPVGGVTPFVRTFNQNSSLTTVNGWDTTTGLGVPNPAFLTLLSAKQ